MKVIALAGGSGTGKTTVAAHLESAGAGHIDADLLGHQLLNENGAVRERILSAFGQEVFLPGGDVDRKKLAEIVFNEPVALENLNAILHPAIIKAAGEQIEEFRKEGKKLVVIDAALLLEVEILFQIDIVIALRCSREEQRRRLKESTSLDDGEVDKRLKNQAHLEKSFHKADFLVDTNKSKEQVFTEIDAIVANIIGG